MPATTKKYPEVIGVALPRGTRNFINHHLAELDSEHKSEWCRKVILEKIAQIQSEEEKENE